MSNIATLNIASLARRLITLLYDSLVLFAVLVFASALTLPFRDKELFSAYQPLLTLYFVAVSFLFFGWFWTHGGQTLGMRAWRLKLVQHNGDALRWRHALLRFLVSVPLWLYILVVIVLVFAPHNNTVGSLSLLHNVPAPVLYLIGGGWLILDHLPNNWRDRLTHSRVVVVPK
jgi:uncharacterized RDD family membrane protein YckC